MISQKITIIVPVYNAAKRLANCLNSIVNQSFANFECILINDGSTDNSLDNDSVKFEVVQPWLSR